MILYHGSNIKVQKPRIINTNNGLDFGAGFYLTSDKKQAKRWAVLKTRRRKKGVPTLSIFEFNDTTINIGKNINIKKYDTPDLELKPSKLTDQYAFLTHMGLQTLKFKEAIKCSIND